MLMGLGADITDDRVPGDRHGLAKWRAVATNDGSTGSISATVFPEGTALGGRQWAGSTVWDPDSERLTLYYTALG